jgi:hypothetical protein
LTVLDPVELAPSPRIRPTTALPATMLDGRLVVPPRIAFHAIGVGKTKGFALIKSGVLKTVKIGRSTRVTVESLERVARQGVIARPTYRRGN